MQVFQNLLHSFYLFPSRSVWEIHLALSSIFLVPPLFWHQLSQVLKDVSILLSVFLLFCSSKFCSSSSFVICLTLLFGTNISSSSFISNKGSSSSDYKSNTSLRKLKKRCERCSLNVRAHKFPALGRPPLLQKTSFWREFCKCRFVFS